MAKELGEKQKLELQKKVQQKYMELQLLNNQMNQLQKQLQLLEQQAVEVEGVQQNLDEFKTVKPGSEIFVPLSSGIFAKAELKENSELLVNVGANTAVTKNVDDTKKLLSEQVGEIRKVQEELAHEFEKLANRAEQLQDELRQMVEESG